MKVRMLTGSQIGAVEDQNRPEAESNLMMGVVELLPEPPPAPVRVAPKRLVMKEKDEE